MEDFGTFMRRIRKEKNMSLQSLTDKMNVWITFLALLENGRKQIPLDYGEKIAIVLELGYQQKMIWIIVSIIQIKKFW